MTIYVDVSAAVHAKAGLSRYASCLAESLEPLLGPRLHLFQNSLGYRGPLEGWPNDRIAGVRWGYRPWRLAVLAQHALARPMDYLLPDGELFHATEHLLPPLRNIPTVMTVHDLIFERLPQHHKFKNRTFLKGTMPLFCRRADAIIAISQATKRDLIDLYNLPESKITVIHEAADARFQPQPEQEIQRVIDRYNLPPRYLVTVGTIEPRKNLSRLADACGPLIDEGLIGGLVVVGSKGWLYEGFFSHVATLPWRDEIIFPGYVDDADLPTVYSGAQLTVVASLYEGFGLPVLEAMGSGSPVCCSNASSLPEVGGDAALLFDPSDTESITATLRQALTDKALASEMRQKGLARAAQFSWQRTAQETLALYERVIAYHSA